MKDHHHLLKLILLFVFLLCIVNSVVLGITDPGDFAVLDEFRKGLDNPALLNWPAAGSDPCGPPQWDHVFCVGARVSQIQVKNIGLKGPLPQNLNKLTELYNIGLQRNNFTGKLPSLNGLKNLQYAFLGNNQFDTIPSDFFVGLEALQVLSLDYNPLNKSSGWVLPGDLAGSTLLANLSLMGCNLVGPMPDFLGGMNSLNALKLSFNRLTGGIPASFRDSSVQILWLNGQLGTGLTGPIDVLASMASLTSVWLHANSFTGPIPEGITACSSLQDLQLYNNQLVGLIPANITNLLQLQSLRLDNNKLMGPIPKLPIQNFTYAGNSFCQSDPGVACSPEVDALLDFLRQMSYPSDLATSWSGNDPCAAPWLGVACVNNNVSSINLPNHKLTGTISPSIGNLNSVQQIRLGGNNLSGTVPEDLAKLESLTMLNLTSNNLQPPLPKFSTTVKVLIDQNPLFNDSPSPGIGPPSSSTPSPPGSPPSSSTPGNPPSTPGSSSPPSDSGQSNSGGKEETPSKASKMSKLLMIIIPVIAGVFIISLVFLFVYCRHKKKGASVSSSSIVVHPRDPSDPENMVKIVVPNYANQSIPASDLQSRKSSERGEAHVIEAGSLVISVQVLRSVTGNFAPENELGRGGFGVVYKGELHDGTMIAVKRMEASVVCNKALDEFQSEISVLSKVRHRNLVSLLGYSVEGNERLLVYEYMPQGALSKHLFHWKYWNIEPMSWKKRLNIALDVARGMEYLHNLAQQSFIHRDLKSSNILLGNDYRAKVSDFGLVRLAPDGKDSVVTRLAGTFGYLAPEYAVTGKVTTKSDVFSFGVVLMELVTGLPALDDSRPEEHQHLASWFYDIKSSNEKLRAALDPSLDVMEETFNSICIIAELAGHCAAREPQQRPDMGHAVSVLVPLVEKWKPTKEDQEEYLGIDLHQPLLQMVKGWQATDCSNISLVSLDDSKGSIPARPYGLAESFTSADGR